MMPLKQIIEDNETAAGKIFDGFIQFLIILSLVTFSIETLPDLSARMQQVLNVLEVFVVVIFTSEYLLRLFVADKKLKFVFSVCGLIDLAAILPFYIAHGLDLRSIRIFRLFRLTRAFKIFRYSKAIQRLKNAFSAVKEELVLFLIATAFVIFIAAVGIYHFENPVQPEQFKSIFHCLWWAVATLTTVGYGDVYPVTIGGKIFTFVILIIGLGIVAVPAGLIASALTKTLEAEKKLSM